MDLSHPFHSGSGNNNWRDVRRIGNIEFLEANRQPCPVCGHPTGDCTSDGAVKPETEMPAQVFGREPMILVEKDITEKRQITPYTHANVLIHRSGDYIPLSRARELGLVN